MVRSSGQKINMETTDLNNTIDNTDLTDTYMKKREKYDQLNDAKKRHMTKFNTSSLLKKTFRKSVYEQQIIGKYQ